MSLELKKFDMKTISFKIHEAKGPVVVLVGRRDTGKSYLVRDLLYYQQDIPLGVVVAGTEEGNGFYGKMVPKLFIHNEYNTAIIENVLKRQKGVLREMKKQMEARIKNQKSTKLLFMNNLPQQPMQPIKISNHFLQFVKTSVPMRPLR
jgi:ABC-type phosphate/phosphonate transport system ATPase subunit